MNNTEQNAKPQKGIDARSRRALIVTTAIILALALACTTVAVIIGINQNKVVDPVLEYENAKLPLTFYSLMLSKTKASLARNGYEVTSMKFWNAASPVEGKTNAEYYTERTLETCKLYLLSVYLFDKEGLKLPASYYESIDAEIADYIELGYIGDGSEEKFNEILSQYGFDAEAYREALIIKGKAEYFQEYLFGSNGSKINNDLKDEYYEKYFYRFKQILISNYYYEYETDEFGYEMYFEGDTNKPLYDTENGVVGFDDNNKYLRDKYEEKIYFEKDEDGKPILDKPLYDIENGVKHPVTDEGGAPKKFYYTDEQMQERYNKAEEIMSSVSDRNYAAFEAEMEKFNDAAEGASENPDGYYLSALSSGSYVGYEYLNDILLKLMDLSEGGRAIVKTEEGYHVVMRYALDDGAYADEDKAVWFDNFTATIMTEVFKEKYKSILENMLVIEENLSLAESITVIGINYDYWK